MKKDKKIRGSKQLGSFIRKSRESLGLKVYELAEKAGVNPVYITQIEKHGKLPSPSVILKISKAINEPRILRHYLDLKHPDLKEINKEIRAYEQRFGAKYKHAAERKSLIEDLEYGVS